MRTAITVAKTHQGKWEMLGHPDDSIIEQKKNFRALRASNAHEDFAIVMYQESDGHLEINRLLTPAQKEKADKQRQHDLAESAAFDRADQDRTDPRKKREAAERAHQAATARAESIEAHARKHNISTAQAEAELFPEETAEAGEDSGPQNEFTRANLVKLTHGELLGLATDLTAAGRLPQMPEGKKSDLIAAILAAHPKPTE